MQFIMVAVGLVFDPNYNINKSKKETNGLLFFELVGMISCCQ
ncbi:MAG: hypothetical protein RIS63_1208 [Bacteroidota bacterium]|jgi:hypothetical protein